MTVGTQQLNFAVLLAAALVACQAPVASFAPEGKQTSALLDLGVPCSAEGDCASGFCVDGVCCDTACGGGVRDKLSCANTYGVVPGLVDGTCTTLTSGNPCGALTSVNPCTWRGSSVNGGGQCPNPPGASVACFPCTSPADCSGAFPVCMNNACVACDGDFGSGAIAACSSTSPVCNNGQCGGCSGCGGTTPVCNLINDTCSACNGDYGSGATLPCGFESTPACLNTGACAQCSATNAKECTGTTPSCDTTVHTCAACNGDYGSGATRACTDPDGPLCLATGACGKCTGSPDCTGGEVCNTTLGNCGAPCVDDSGCVSSEWCATGVCTPKLPHGSALPPIAPIDGLCTSANGARVCLSGVCSTADQRCGFPNGYSCGPPADDVKCRAGVCYPADNRCGLPAGDSCAFASQCRSSLCSPSNTCGSCAVDADCGGIDSGSICDAITLSCKSGCRGTGNGCSPDRTCTSTDERPGKCAQCTADEECGEPTSGLVCNENRECASGCRGEGGNACGGDAVCSSGDGSVGVCLTVEGGGASCASASGSSAALSTGILGLIAMTVTARVLRRRRS